MSESYKKILFTWWPATGKTTIANELCSFFDWCNIPYSRLVPDTTRTIRDKEENGIDYNFISKKQYKENYVAWKYLWSLRDNRYNKGYYWTSKEWIEFDNTKFEIILPTCVAVARDLKELFMQQYSIDDILWFHLYANRKVKEERLSSRNWLSNEVKIRLSQWDTLHKENMAINIDTWKLNIQQVIDLLTKDYLKV